MDISKKSDNQLNSSKLHSVIIHAPDSDCVIEDHPCDLNIETLHIKPKFCKVKAPTHSKKFRTPQVPNQISSYLNNNMLPSERSSSISNSAISLFSSNEFESSHSQGQRKVGKRKPIALVCSTVCILF